MLTKMFRYNRNFSGVHTDIHSHLIPGIDDGAKNIEESILLLQGLQDLGYQRVITTPHIYSSLYPNTKTKILNAFFKLRTQIRGLNLKIHLGIAAEYFIDPHFFSLIEKKDLLSLPGDYVLIETSPFGQVNIVMDCIFKLKVHGYKPLLAHPERYLFLQKSFDVALMLQEQGCHFQINMLSLLGFYGKRVKNTALLFYNNGLVNFWGSDVHNERQLNALKKGLRSRKFYKMINDPTISNKLLHANTELISDKHLFA